jgi:hypothetical protein
VEGERRLLPVDGCGSSSKSSCFWVLWLVPMWDLRFIGLVRDSLASKKRCNMERKKKPEKENGRKRSHHKEMK